ncbi:methenyltetrahydromethanopterin cyclohydrolase [Archaeoglobus sulfaticallidus PM70-1]|uniref:Methenyltetrahydromethanopterin cyclohydrolase n=1 Tax=Archaeoglobus sulfaticallidus PM70-1 TaxID=387631 RepID=N0BI09_9EURY|nr:methenyltetrahydromethanopterin cyclohydrolase [Archaeoglobus sulfaticallidus]AGK61932.1 methenyltetrahydromethanopterin cyclohydrolase [Archaeoglobus sulfaticallidus PM70-1]
MVSINEMAMDIVEDMLDFEEELRIESKKLENGATVIDCGVNVPGGYEAGILYTQICMGGLAEIEIVTDTINDVPFAFITEYTDHPAVACLGSQKAGWAISVGKYFAMGSGPARALALKPKKTYEKIEYQDDSEYAVIALEASKLPNEEVMEFIAKECDVDPENVYAVVAPTASIVGSVQISGRIVETAIYKMTEIGYDPKLIVSGAGRCPIAPIVGDDLKAMGSTNDSMMYYGSVFLTVKEYDEILKNVPSNTSKDYGKPFYEIFKDANFDFYKIDPNLFAPAQIAVNDLSTGKTYVHGKLNAEVLFKSYNIQL